MFDRFQASVDASDLERTAKACLLLSAPPSERTERLRDLARLAVERVENRRWLHWYELALGLAEYRVGDMEATVKVLDGFLQPDSLPVSTVPALAIQAMALSHLGQTATARERLDRADRLIAAHFPRERVSVEWSNWLIARCLVHEARAIVRFDPIFPVDPFAH